MIGLVVCLISIPVRGGASEHLHVAPEWGKCASEAGVQVAGQGAACRRLPCLAMVSVGVRGVSLLVTSCCTGCYIGGHGMLLSLEDLSSHMSKVGGLVHTVGWRETPLIISAKSGPGALIYSMRPLSLMS